MAALNLVVEKFDDSPEIQGVDKQAFDILRDFLPLDSKTPLHTAAKLVLALLPDGSLDGLPALALWNLCIELAKQIPYSHPSQLKLARLLQQLALASKLGGVSNNPLSSLGNCFRDSLTFPNPENLTAWVNFHSFVAKVEFHVWPTLAEPTWAIWAMRDAFEQADEYYPSSAVRDIYVLAAAQYILWKGQDLIQRILYPGDVSALDEQHWAPGPKYAGSPRLDLKRWDYWRDGFSTEAERSTASDEIKTVAGKAAKLMNTLEEATPGLS